MEDGDAQQCAYVVAISVPRHAINRTHHSTHMQPFRAEFKFSSARHRLVADSMNESEKRLKWCDAQLGESE
uniref:Uncharacterized protein n=1 Tax=Ascaris lumbricoides TaxID=6252 RepID=A0A0M3IVJ1_ASCLU